MVCTYIQFVINNLTQFYETTVRVRTTNSPILLDRWFQLHVMFNTLHQIFFYTQVLHWKYNLSSGQEMFDNMCHYHLWGSDCTSWPPKGKIDREDTVHNCRHKMGKERDYSVVLCRPVLSVMEIQTPVSQPVLMALVSMQTSSSMCLLLALLSALVTPLLMLEHAKWKTCLIGRLYNCLHMNPVMVVPGICYVNWALPGVCCIIIMCLC